MRELQEESASPAVHTRTTAHLPHSMCLFKHKTSLSLNITEAESEFMVFSVQRWRRNSSRSSHWIPMSLMGVNSQRSAAEFNKSMCVLKLRLRPVHYDWTLEQSSGCFRMEMSNFIDVSGGWTYIYTFPLIFERSEPFINKYQSTAEILYRYIHINVCLGRRKASKSPNTHFRVFLILY